MHRVSQFLFFVSIFVACFPHDILACDEKEKASTLLDASMDMIDNAKSLYPNCVDDKVNCVQKVKSLAFLDVALNVISRVKKEFPVCPDPVCPEPPVARPTDCAEILASGKRESGVYTIWPKSRTLGKESLSVYCDMDTDGGGWTVIQRRGQFSTPKDYFYKYWADYKNGFGNLTEEFWIGNDNIHAISNQANYSIRFDLKDHEGDTGYAVYDHFRIEDESANYTLHISGYSGNVGDSMSALNKMKFSTRDRNNDKWSQSCAREYRGAWWYRMCTNANLNGLYQPGTSSDTGMTWFHWKKSLKGLAWVEMKLRS